MTVNRVTLTTDAWILNAF